MALNPGLRTPKHTPCISLWGGHDHVVLLGRNTGGYRFRDGNAEREKKACKGTTVGKPRGQLFVSFLWVPRCLKEKVIKQGSWLPIQATSLLCVMPVLACKFIPPVGD